MLRGVLKFEGLKTDEVKWIYHNRGSKITCSLIKFYNLAAYSKRPSIKRFTSDGSILLSFLPFYLPKRLFVNFSICFYCSPMEASELVLLKVC